MRRKFNIILEELDSGYIIHIPELDQITQADNLDDVFEVANDCICNTICSYEDEGMDIFFHEFNINKVSKDNRIAIIDIDTDKYRKEIINKSRKVTLTIPEYLYIAATKLNLNKSKLLQDAIKREINNK